MKLPAIKNKVIIRPGEALGRFNKCFVPNPIETDFWSDLHYRLAKMLQCPILECGQKIDSFFGYFGERFHPVALKPKYFHIGIDIMADSGTKISSITDGILEYSGFSELNGNYVMISHPHIITQDEFILHSLYLHLEKFYLRFNIPQKIFREVGMKRFAVISVSSKDSIGEVGATGNVRDLVPHIHLQMEFRDKKGTIIAVNPALALGVGTKENLTASISSLEEFRKFYKYCGNNLLPWSKLWKEVI